MFGRAGRLAAALAILALFVAPALPGATGGRVLAHAQLVASSPGAGEVVEDPPTELRLVFSERLEATGTSVDVVAADGSLVVDRGGEIDPDDPYALVVPLLELGDGTYSVSWRTLSSDDGHPAEGVLSFGVGEAGVVAGGGALGGHEHPAPDPLAVTARWLTYPGMLLALGLPLFHRGAVRTGPMPRQLRRLLGVALAIAAVASVAAALLAGAQAGDPIGYLGTRAGVLILARAGVAALGGAVLLIGPGAVALPVALGAGLATTLLHVMAGHASALDGIAGLLAQWMHVVAAGVWAGGVVTLALLLARPALVTGTSRRPDIRSCVPRFSALALVSIGLLGLTGIHAAWRQTGAILDPSTEYGSRLLLKSAFAVGALALGGVNFLDGGRMLAWLSGMRARVRLETILIAAVLLFSALLAVTPPRDDVSGVAIEPVPDAFGRVAPGMSMEIVPGRPGVNRAIVTATDALVSASLSLSLDRLDATASTRVPLTLSGGAGVDHAQHGMARTSPDRSATWMADALVLPEGSQWNAAVRIAVDEGGDELSRQRFAFALGEDAIIEGEVGAGLDPGLLTGLVLLVLGTLAIGAGIGGARLPRCEPSVSAQALVVGGLVGAGLGAGIGVERLLGI
jgi:copper transport protein